MDRRTRFVAIHLSMANLGGVHLLATVNNTFVNIYVQVLCEHVFSSREYTCMGGGLTELQELVLTF